jgi:hypothetical protein
MAPPVYSTSVIRLAGFSGGPTLAYVVPAGQRLVVKNIAIVWGNVIASGIDAWLQDAGLVKLARYTWAFTVANPTNFGGTAQWWGMWVFDEGEELYAQTASGTCDISAHGYLLSTP